MSVTPTMWTRASAIKFLACSVPMWPAPIIPSVRAMLTPPIPLPALSHSQGHIHTFFCPERPSCHHRHDPDSPEYQHNEEHRVSCRHAHAALLDLTEDEGREDAPARVG